MKKLKQWWINFKSKTPQRNKKLRNIAIQLVTSAVALDVYFSTNQEKLSYFPSYTSNILTYIIVAGVIFGLYHQSQTNENTN